MDVLAIDPGTQIIGRESNIYVALPQRSDLVGGVGDRFVTDCQAMSVFKTKMRELLKERSLKKSTMAAFVNSEDEQGFRAMLAKRHAEEGTDIDARIPASINVADSTVRCWMKRCEAVYG